MIRDLLTAAQLIQLYNDIQSYPVAILVVSRWIENRHFKEDLFAGTDSRLNTVAYSFEGKGVDVRMGIPPWHTTVWVRHRESGSCIKVALNNRIGKPLLYSSAKPEVRL